MAILTGRLGSWTLPHVHMWRDRTAEITFERRPLVRADSRVATIGSCFASELAGAMARLGLRGSMHPTGLFYTTRSIRQEIERIFGGWPAYAQEPVWQTAKGFIDPFKDYHQAFPTREQLDAWRRDLDRRGEELFRSADVIVITLGLIESWFNPASGNHYRQIPHPEVFETLKPSFTRLTFAEMYDDLVAIRGAIRAHTNAEIIVTVSPIPLHATVTPHDVRIANTESKHRIRAVVSEFLEAFPDVHYFHSYEIVTTAERMSDFMLEDGRHVSRHAVDYIVQQFMAMFAADETAIPQVDLGWLTNPSKIAASIHRPATSPWQRLRRALRPLKAR